MDHIVLLRHLQGIRLDVGFLMLQSSRFGSLWLIRLYLLPQLVPRTLPLCSQSIDHISDYASQCSGILKLIPVLMDEEKEQTADDSCQQYTREVVSQEVCLLWLQLPFAVCQLEQGEQSQGQMQCHFQIIESKECISGETGHIQIRNHLYRAQSTCAGMGSILVSSSFSILITLSWSFSVIRLMASPICPYRPERPIRCRQVLLQLGKSKLMTTLTACTSMPLAIRLELTRVLYYPFLKRSKTFILSSPFILECRYSFWYFFQLSLRERNSALLLDLQKMMHWLMMRELQSLKMALIFSLSSTSMQQCVSPINISSSIRLITSARGMNFSLKDFILSGKVALYINIEHLGGTWLMISSTSLSKLPQSSLSAQSKTKNSQWSSRVSYLLTRSLRRPGVHTTTCISLSYILLQSSLTMVPPMNSQMLVLVNLLIFCANSCTCSASSLVGTRITAWMYFDFSSISLIRGMRKPPVLPVPFLARAMMLLRAVMRGMDSYWMGVGTTQLCQARARMTGSRSLNSLKFLYLLALMSQVGRWVLWSAPGFRNLSSCSRGLTLRCPSLSIIINYSEFQIKWA